MRRHSLRFGSSDAFGPGTDLVVSLFTVITCLLAFAVRKNVDVEDSLLVAQKQVETISQANADFVLRLLENQRKNSQLNRQVDLLHQELDGKLDESDAVRLCQLKLSQFLSSDSEVHPSLLSESGVITRGKALLDDIGKIQQELHGQNQQVLCLFRDSRAMPADEERSSKDHHENMGQARKKLGNISATMEAQQLRISELSGQAENLLPQLDSVLHEQQMSMRTAVNKIQQELEAEGKLKQELLGIEGKLGHVVFVVDASGSMGNNTGRWEQAQALIHSWLSFLPVENAALIVFNDQPFCFPADRSFWKMDDTSRNRLASQLKRVRPAGRTATLDAIRMAFEYEEIDTIILFTDGRPEDGTTSTEQLADDILTFVDANQHRQVVINTIGLGDYFRDGKNPASVTFSLLVKLAEKTNGSFRGR